MEFQEFVRIYNEEQKHLSFVVRSFPWTDKNAYMEWLANGYEYIFNSTRILALAGGLMPRHLTQFSNRLITHASEEKGHEKLLETDVAGFGCKIQDVPVTDEMKLFHHSLYYWLSPMGSPLGIFGFVIALESVPAVHGQWVYQQIKPAFGEKCTRFIKVHAGEDPDHLEKAMNVVKNLRPEEVAVVAESMIEYSRQYARVMTAIACKYPHKKTA